MKALLFDACDILYHRPLYDQKLEAFFGPEWPALNRKNKDKIKALQFEAARGLISLDEMYNGMLSLYGLPASRHEEGRRFLSEVMADVTFFDAVCPTLHRLKSDGFKLAIVTNSFQSGKTKLEWFAKAGIDTLWDAFVSSSETGSFKPEAAIYLAALKQLECRAQDAAFIAHSANELDGAKALGMTTIAFNRDNDQVRADYILEHFSQLVDIARASRNKHQGAL